MATRAHYEMKLRNAYENIFRMGISAKNALEKAATAFRDGDKDLAQKVKDEDVLIDRQQLSVDTQIITLIATEHPVAQDLREIVSSLKIAVELERFADHAAHLAKAVLKLGKRPPATYIDAVDHMVGICTEMLDLAMTAFLDQDAAAAKRIADRDDEIDSIHKVFVRNLLSRTDVQEMEDIATLLFVGRYLERMGDHVTNICEWIVYGALGEQVELNV